MNRRIKMVKVQFYLIKNTNLNPKKKIINFMFSLE